MARPRWHRAVCSHLSNLDEIVRAAERDVHEASALLVAVLAGGLPGSPGEQNDWPDRLAGDLARNPSMSLGTWADGHGLARETVSRGFTKAYGITPEVFRAELRTKAAWFRITRESERLGTIAAETGFADQAHMSRWVHRLTGLPPLAWRREPCPSLDFIRSRGCAGIIAVVHDHGPFASRSMAGVNCLSLNTSTR